MKLSQHFFFDLVLELSDTLCIVLAQGNSDHITSTAHSTCYQARDSYETFTVNLVTLPPHPTQAKEK
jgi:hypothetical protein